MAAEVVAVLKKFPLLVVVVVLAAAWGVGLGLGTLEKAAEVRVVSLARRGKLEPRRVARRILARETLLVEKPAVRGEKRPPGASALPEKQAVGRMLKKASLLLRRSTLKGVPELSLVPEPLRAEVPAQGALGKAESQLLR